MQLAPPVRSPARGRSRGRGRRPARRPSARSTRTLTNLMVVLFLLGGIGIARPSLLELLPDLDWDPRGTLRLFDRPAEDQPDVPEGASG